MKIWKWLEENPKVTRDLEDFSFYACKDGEDFGAADVDAILKHHKLEVDFKARDILSVWRNGRPPKKMKTREEKQREAEREKEKARKLEEGILSWLRKETRVLNELKEERESLYSKGKKFNRKSVESILQRLSIKSVFKTKDICWIFKKHFQELA